MVIKRSQQIKQHKDNRGMIQIESVFILPIFFLVFAGVFMTAIYLPQRAALQNATQTAAIMLATERSDSWLRVNDERTGLTIVARKPNVYGEFFGNFVFGWTRGSRNTTQAVAEEIVRNVEQSRFPIQSGELEVTTQITNWVVYQQIEVTAIRTIQTPFILPIINYPLTITVSSTSSAVIQNADEFVRTMDMAMDLFNRFTPAGITNNIRRIFPGFGNYQTQWD